MRIEIVNVVATADIGKRIDLDEISRMPQVIYNPSKYRCVYFKDDGMQAKVSIFPSGKMIAVGAKSEDTARRDLLHVTQSLGVNVDTIKVEIRNIVATVDLETAIDLEALQDMVPGIIYEPEQFPGAIFRPARHHVTVLIFGSGKLVLAGLKSESEIKNAVAEVLEPLGL
jgi:transcription initiation factor TFIID TATA-box-binding protein